MQYKFSIACTEFKNLRTSSDGGAILLGNMIGMITGNSFTNCSTIAKGGASYLGNCSVTISNNVFSSCYNGQQDYNFGNVLYSKRGFVNIKQCSASLCGPTKKECGDSTLSFNDGQFSLNYFNSSFNNDFYGGDLGRFSCNSPSYISYCQCYHPYSGFTFIEILNSMSISHCNFIDDTNISSFLCKSEVSLKVTFAYLINCTKPSPKIIYENSYSDPLYKNLNQTNEYPKIEFQKFKLCILVNKANIQENTCINSEYALLPYANFLGIIMI